MRAILSKIRRINTMIRVLFICHCRTRTFVWNGLKSSILVDENGICTPRCIPILIFHWFVNRTALDKKEIKIQLVPLDFWNMLDLFCQKYSYPMGNTLSLCFQPERIIICFGSNWKRMILISMSLSFLGRAMTRSRNSSQDYPVEKSRQNKDRINRNRRSVLRKHWLSAALRI